MDEITKAAIMEQPLDDGMDKLDLEDSGQEPEVEEASATEAEGKTPDTEAKAKPAVEAEVEPAESEEDPKAVIAAVKAELEYLKKENKGLLGKGVAETEKRQQLEGRVAQMTEFLRDLKSGKVAEAEEKPAPKFRGLPIMMTDDGEAYVPEEQMDEYINKKIRPIESKITGTTAKLEQDDNKKATSSALDRIIGEHEAYPTAYKTVQGTFNALLELVAEQNGGKLPPLLPEPMLNAVLDSPAEKAFTEKYPGVDVVDLITTFTSTNPKLWPKKLRSILNAHIPAPEPEKKGQAKPATMDPRQKALAGKPRSPAGVRGAVGPQPTEFERIARLGTRDFLRNMDDKKMAELDRLLEADG